MQVVGQIIIYSSNIVYTVTYLYFIHYDCSREKNLINWGIKLSSTVDFTQFKRASHLENFTSFQAGIKMGSKMGSKLHFVCTIRIQYACFDSSRDELNHRIWIKHSTIHCQNILLTPVLIYAHFMFGPLIKNICIRFGNNDQTKVTALL